MSRALTLVTALVAVVAVNSAPCSPTTAVQLVGQFLTQAFVNFDINEAGSFTSGWLLFALAGGVPAATASQPVRSVSLHWLCRGFRVDPRWRGRGMQSW